MRRHTYGCGLEAALAVVGGKWKPIVLWHLTPEPRRFGELRRLVTGISEKMLIQELKEMVVDGLAIREDYQEVPPKVVYRLTDAGMSLAEACKPLCTLGNEIIKREGLTMGHVHTSIARAC